MPLGKKKKKVLVRVCELVTCEIATVVMKGRKDESQDVFFFPASDFMHPALF